MEAVFFVIFLHFLSRFYTYDVFFPAYILVRWKERDDMFLLTGRCGTLIRRDKGAGSRLCRNVRKS